MKRSVAGSANQLQSYPFHMTAENMAKHRLDPNIDFWKQIKVGADHFEAAKTEPSVLVCGQHYEFDATPKGAVSAGAPCPALQRDESIEAAVAEKEDKDDATVAELVASGVKPIRTVYADGGQNPVFAGYKDVSDPEALVSGAQEIVLENRVKPAWAATAADAARQRAEKAPPAAAQARPQIADAPDAPATPEPSSAE